MQENRASMAGWADEAFGKTPSLARIAARANEELAELLRAVTAGEPVEEAITEAADVAIVLSRMLDPAGPDPYDALRATPVVPGGVVPVLLACQDGMTELLRRTLPDLALPASAVQDCTAALIADLGRVATALGGDLARAIDAKMAINRNRRWRCDGSGQGYHV